MTAAHWIALAACSMFAAPLWSQPAPRSSDSGVYTREQVSRGQDVYIAQCRSCHTTETHTSPAFHAAWGGKPLSELFTYLRERMPKNEPASLSDQEYIDVLTYLLRLNRAPEGSTELPADMDALKGIRFDPRPLAVRKEK